MKKSYLAAFILTLIPLILLAETTVDLPEHKNARKNMVFKQIKMRSVTDKKVLDAMTDVPRHLFVPKKLIPKAYADCPLPIGEGQTISQPYVVALMTEKLALTGEERVLEIGTGSGYQAAILSEIAKEVYTIEIKRNLYKKSSAILHSLGLVKVKTRHGDGYFGWNESAPFDCIMITASVNHIPPPLLKQLKNGGRLILPLGNPFSYQNLVLVTKKDNDYTIKQITGVLFVPMTGYALKAKFNNP